jgi:lipopolysaccharide export LptBFGC system permease protein LptF
VAVAVTAAIVANTIVGMNVAGGRKTPILLALLVPQALPIAIPLGMMMGVFAWSRRREGATRRLLPVVSAAVGCSLASFFVLVRVAPDANQAFRQTVFDAYVSADQAGSTAPLPLPRGANELTMGQLRSFVASDTMLTPPDDIRSLAFVYYRRWALAAASLVLTAFALAVAARWGHRRRRMVSATAAGIAAYVILLPAVGRGFFGGAPAAAAWTPNAALLVAALALWASALTSKERSPA